MRSFSVPNVIRFDSLSCEKGPMVDKAAQSSTRALYKIFFQISNKIQTLNNYGRFSKLIGSTARIDSICDYSIYDLVLPNE